MTTIVKCRAINCIFNEDRTCTSEKIRYDPEEGCLTYEELGDLVDLDDEDEEWDDDELLGDEDDDNFLHDDDLLLLDDELEIDDDDDDDWGLRY